MDCSLCGARIDPDVLTCPSCGSAAAATCPHCSRSLRAGVRFCPGCGARVSATAGAGAESGRDPSSGAPLPESFAAGRYRVTRFLGEGSNKRVFLATDTRLERDVAIALIKAAGLAGDGRDRIRREAQAMARLGDHPHIVTIYDIGDVAGEPYLVMHFMAGGNLEELLRSAASRRLPLGEIVRIAEQICLALEHAHAHAIVHRDLKPSNVWLTAGGTVKLGDFGLALALDRSRLTEPGSIAGTPSYMAPEQATSAPLDARADLYSLGVMLYEMVTGQLPFVGEIFSIIHQHVNAAPVAPSRHNPEIPPALEALILRLLAKAPEDRPAGAADVRELLAGVARALATGAGGETLLMPGGRSSLPSHPLDRLIGGGFVGRTAEMETLRTAFEAVRAGQGRLLLLGGEAGIGKTCVAEELATYARLRGAHVLWGRCYEGDPATPGQSGAPAFWPWIQIIRAYAQERDLRALHPGLASGLTAIAQLVSEVREQLPDLPPPAPLSAEEARFRLFDGVTAFFRTIAGDAGGADTSPLVLILEDLHWADRPSLLLLQFLARELGGARVLVLGTYRDLETGRRDPLAEVIADLSRERLVERIHLPGLSLAEVSELLAVMARQEPGAGGGTLAETLHRETEGNPLFVQEIVRHLVETGAIYQRDGRWVSDAAGIARAGIPDGVRKLIGRRLARLSEQCNRVLGIAAVSGREFDIGLLEPAGDLSLDSVLDALEEAEAARVIAEERATPGRYRFTHALIRQTLYDDLSAARRIRLHARIGEALVGRWGAEPGAHAAEIAHHFLQAAPAGEAERAILYARLAGERALALLAYEEAVRFYAMALRVLELMVPAEASARASGGAGDALAREEQRCTLLLALGDAQQRAGDTADAKASFWQAAAIARTLGERGAAVQAPSLLARAALGACLVAESGMTDAPLIRLLQEALTALREKESSLRARLLAQLAWALYWSGKPEQTAALSAQAVEIARRLGDPATLAEVLASRHWVLWRPEDAAERLRVAEDIIVLAEAAHDKRTALEGHLWRMINMLEMGDLPAADSELAIYGQLAEELKRPQFLSYAAALRAMRALVDGPIEEADRATHAALSLGARSGHRDVMGVYAAQLFLVRQEQGRLAELEGFFTGFLDQYTNLPILRMGYALLHIRLGRPAEARRVFEQLAANDFKDLPQDNSWLSAVTILAEVCANLGDAERAAMLYALLRPYAGRCVVAGQAIVALGATSRYLGMLAATLSQWDEAARHFEEAIALQQRMGARPWTAHTQHDYAAMLLTPACPLPNAESTARDLLHEALTTARALGITRLEAQASALLGRQQQVSTPP